MEDVAGVYYVSPPPVQRSLNDPTVSLSDPKTWEILWGDYRTETGESIDVAKAVSVPAIWQAISLISGDIAKLPFELYRRRPDISDDARELARDEALSALVRLAPNETTTAIKFWRRVMVHVLLWGNAYVWIERESVNEAAGLVLGTGSPVGLYPLLPDRTWTEVINGTQYFVTESMGGGASQLRAIPTSDVLHLEWINYGDKDACSLLFSARNSIALNLAQERFASKFFKHGGRVGGILELPSGMPKPARDVVEQGFRQSYEGTENPFKTVILRDSAKFHEAQRSPEESQLVDANEQQVRQIARWFNLSPSKLGLSDSVSYNSKSEDNQAYLDSTLAIWLAQIAAECNAKLLTTEQQSSLFFEHNVGALLRMNQLQRYQAYQIAITNRFLSPNEVRAAENRMPYDGGDIFENPNTTTTATSQAEQQDQPADVQAASSPTTGFLRVLYTLTANARHRAENPTSFCNFIDGNLAWHRKQSQDLVGNDQLVEQVHKTLKKIAATATADQLYGEVDAAMGRLEQEMSR